MSAVQTEAERLQWTGRDSTVPAPVTGEPPHRPSEAPAPWPAVHPHVRPRAKPRAGAELRRGLVAIALVGAMAAAAVAGSVAVAQQGFAVDGARAQIQRLQGQNRQLVAQLAELQSPQRIESEAIDRLGMQRPAGYVPVAAQPVPAAPSGGAAATAQATLPVPAGPAPGGARAVARSTLVGVQALWRRIRG